jgi:hypothetical protein
MPDRPGSPEERAWQVVSAAFAERAAAPRRRASRPSLAAASALVAGLAITAVALSATGSVLSTVRDALGVRRAAPLLVSLPAAGRLLVQAASGPWIVGRDGSKRRLGGATFAQTAWSPHGLFEVTVIGGDELAAIDPKGTVRWKLARPAVHDPRWSGDGYRIAYRSGRALRVVAGDGTGDHLVAARVAPVAPAWDGATHELAYADDGGRVHAVDADTGAVRWVSLPGPAPTALRWLPGGGLVVLTGHSLRVLRGDDGRPAGAIALGGGGHVLAVSSAGLAAVTSRTPGGQSSILLLHPASPHLAPTQIFHGTGAFDGLAWSPGGRWLLASWRTAGQWVFIDLGSTPGAPERVQAVSSIAREFDSRTQPVLAGWCCTAGMPQSG